MDYALVVGFALVVGWTTVVGSDLVVGCTFVLDCSVAVGYVLVAVCFAQTPWATPVVVERYYVDIHFLA